MTMFQRIITALRHAMFWWVVPSLLVFTTLSLFVAFLSVPIHEFYITKELLKIWAEPFESPLLPYLLIAPWITMVFVFSSIRLRPFIETGRLRAAFKSTAVFFLLSLVAPVAYLLFFWISPTSVTVEGGSAAGSFIALAFASVMLLIAVLATILYSLYAFHAVRGRKPKFFVPVITTIGFLLFVFVTWEWLFGTDFYAFFTWTP